MTNARRVTAALAVAFALFSSLSACSNTAEDKQLRGQLIGGATGAAVGSLFGSGSGAVLAVGAGAVLGTIAGGEIASE
jgi:uncharacterized protein YcfJ